EYYFRLSEIVRAYIEARFLIAAPDMTTEEFLSTLARGDAILPGEHVGRLRPFMEACDYVKYAALTPDVDAAVQALGTARNFVQTTAGAIPDQTRGGQAA
ncbi:MAG: hypothetical protein JXO22_05380, partial [Phycisphaerae bacterium]|nr:hypothetical protein [Phycisphaerae bacterium]